jgi:hypothetical protein
LLNVVFGLDGYALPSLPVTVFGNSGVRNLTPAKSSPTVTALTPNSSAILRLLQAVSSFLQIPNRVYLRFKIAEIFKIRHMSVFEFFRKTIDSSNAYTHRISYLLLCVPCASCFSIIQTASL